MNGKGDKTASRTDWKKWFSDNNPLPEKIVKLWARDEKGKLIDERFTDGQDKIGI